jgi:hypothetical protein
MKRLWILFVILSVAPFYSGFSQNYAISLDGNNDYINIPNSSSFNWSQQATIECWAKLTELHAGVIFNKWMNSTEDKEIWITSDGTVAFLLFGLRSEACISNTPLSLNQWHHIVGTTDGQHIYIYIDGYIDNSLNTTGNYIGNSNNPAVIGQMYYRPPYDNIPISGETDEMRIWNIYKSPEEIRAMMYQEATGSEPGLVAVWHFNEGSGQVTYDASPNANNGRLGSTTGSDPQDPQWVISTAPLGLVGYWNFDEGSGNILHDVSGNNNDGTIRNAFWDSGIDGEALNFDGDSDFVDFSNPVLNVAPYTVCAWVKPNTISDGNAHYIISNGGQNFDSYGFWLCQQEMQPWLGYWEFGGRNTNGSLGGAAHYLPSSTDWVFLCGSWDGTSNLGSIKLYVNGLLKNSTSPALGEAGPPQNLRIGAPSNYLNRFEFSGKIDEVRIYNRVLDEESILNLYQSTVGLGTISGIVTETDGTTAIPGVLIRALQDNIEIARFTTGPDGQYTLANLPVGIYDVEASKFGYVTQTLQDVEVVAGQTTPIDFQLQLAPTADITGFVHDAQTGEGMGGAIIEFLQNNNVRYATTSAPATGLYELDGIYAGSYNIRYSAANYQTQIIPKDVDAGYQMLSTVSLVPLERPIATIQIISPDDYLSSGEQVTFSGSGSGGSLIIEYRWASDIDGVLSTQNSFTIDILTIGTHNISFSVKNSDGLWSEPDDTTLYIIDGMICRPGSYEIFVPGMPCEAIYSLSPDNPCEATCNATTGWLSAFSTSFTAEGKALSWHGATFELQQPRWMKAEALLISFGGKAGGGLHSVQCSELCLEHSYFTNPDQEIPDFKEYYSKYIDPPLDIDFYTDVILDIVSWISPGWVGNFTDAISFLSSVNSFTDMYASLNSGLEHPDLDIIQTEPIYFEAGKHHIDAFLYTWTKGIIGQENRAGILRYIILRACEPNEGGGELSIHALCPIEMTVTDPLGRTIDKDTSLIPDANYMPGDMNMDGDTDWHVFIPNAIDGHYNIIVRPDSTADSTDTFSLIASYNGTLTYMAENLPVSQISSEPYSYVIGSCSYIPGDANGVGGFTGLDVTYSVRYFKGGPLPPYSCDCPPHGIWFVSGDVNGSCSFTGLDVTYMVRYFKGGPAPIPCPDCPPAGR